MLRTDWILRASSVCTLFASMAWAGSSSKVIYSFAGDEDGEYADTDLVVDTAGNIYGTTVQGGDFGSGTVWQLSPTNNGWVHTVIYDFKGTSDRSEPYKGVTLDAQGNLYGTAVAGGLYTGPCADSGCGVTYKLTNLNGVWTQTVIHSFTGGRDGYGPGARVTIDSQGNVYGTTPTGGAHGQGVVYQLKPDGSGNYTERIIHAFTGGADGGGGSAARPIIDSAGSLFGLCTTGGAHGAGTVYELSPTASGQWNVTTLFAFRGEPDAGFPYGGLISDGKGNFYGTTYYAGANDLGTIYRLSIIKGSWTETGLYSFKGNRDGSSPISTLAADAAGNLYGTTSEARAPSCNCGTIFKITLTGSHPAYSVVHRFQGPPDGAFPYNGMVAAADGTVLYGATVHGGANNEGAIYQLNP